MSDTDHITIRSARAEEADRVVELLSIAEPQHLATASGMRTLLRAGDPAAGGQTLVHIVVAEASDHRLVGAAMVGPAAARWAHEVVTKARPLLGDHYADLFPRVVAELSEIAVEEPYRRRGIGLRLMEAAVHACLTSRYRLMVWFFRPKDKGAVAFYESIGATCLDVHEDLVFASPSEEGVFGRGLQHGKLRAGLIPLVSNIYFGNLNSTGKRCVVGLWNGVPGEAANVPATFAAG
ncbi:GNAT family N-acetyltransferase [Kitasatospora sp. NPDC056076]|uniref:GNAT family N-acetyltransferase n=1 Tax=Kitasatospora sp. NPDC056076 TaxID=3345703 RepID=UPI0035D5A1DA